jgi:hypothetical protein
VPLVVVAAAAAAAAVTIQLSDRVQKVAAARNIRI